MSERSPNRSELGIGRLFDAIRDAVVVGDIDSGRIVMWNPAATTMFGYTESEAIGSPLELLIPPDLAAAHRAGSVNVLGGGTSAHLDTGDPLALVARHKDGTPVDIEMTLGSLTESYVMAVITDVGARRRAEEELERFFALSLDLLCVANFDGYFVRLNSAWETLLGWSAAELLGEPFMDFVHPDDVDATIDAMSQITQGNPVLAFENRYRMKDGEYRWMQWNANPSRERELIYAVARDVTDQKRIQQELVQRDEELVRLDAHKTRFIADAAHELRQPLATLSGYAHLLSARRDLMTPEQLQRSFTALERQSEHVDELITSLLDLSQLENPDLVVDVHPIHTGAVIARALETAPAPPGKTVSADCDADVVVRADEARLAQVLVNLLTNAYRYGGDAISIKVAPQEDRVSVTVADNGSGVPEHLVARMFEPFARGSNTADIQGSGLGLAIVRRIVLAFGGEVAYETAQPYGARFVLQLRRG